MTVDDLAARSASPLDAAIGLSFHAYADDGVVLRLDPAPASLGSEDPVSLHGGTLATCVDTAAWYAVVRERPGEWVAADLRCDFLRVAGDGPHRVHATCLRAGRTLAVADVTIAPWDEPERAVAVGRAQFLRIGGDR